MSQSQSSQAQGHTAWRKRQDWDRGVCTVTTQWLPEMRVGWCLSHSSGHFSLLSFAPPPQLGTEGHGQMTTALGCAYWPQPLPDPITVPASLFM